MRPIPISDGWGAEYSKWWKSQRAAQQNAMVGSAIEVTAQEKPPVIHPATPQKQDGNPECVNCTVKKNCQGIMRMWAKRAARPDIVRAWIKMSDDHAPEMICLSKLREA